MQGQRNFLSPRTGSHFPPLVLISQNEPNPNLWVSSVTLQPSDLPRTQINKGALVLVFFTCKSFESAVTLLGSGHGTDHLVMMTYRSKLSRSITKQNTKQQKKKQKKIHEQ